ncbi:tRNA(Met) cytidine acetyltransferase TmcA [Marinobacterium lutimaris]|uniref:tRNA(Met) cytidine acetyltransferase TmcA n=1 Tax=Marinobacterium lutimaris TaxID=568106 RepID=A0A1H5YGC1_9GAMM|nr:GNAT family N-acetyltransferase [Marinobacterium lutimaris]SEG23149.1 tRNA(Met)-cytidine N(4)-acetyltransferase [Marinobacterium lutimaris]
MIDGVFGRLGRRLVLSRHRGLLWLAGDESFCAANLPRLIDSLASTGSGLVFSNRDLGADIEYRPLKRAGEILGQTHPWIVFDAYSGFNPNTLAQIAGTVAAGGWLVILAPDSGSWPGFNDPEYRQLSVEPWAPQQLEPRYLRRVVRMLDADPAVVKWSASGVGQPNWPDLSPPVAAEAPYLSEDQQRAVDRLLRALAQRRCKQVLSADRGRGKSAALGLALALKAQQKPLKVALTAPSRAALDALFERIEALLGPIEWQGNSGQAGSLRLEYRAPAELAEVPLTADLLVIDEAAAIATPVLAQLSRCYSRVLFATTQHGYEGNGRGFTLRFMAELRALAPEVAEIHLQTPVRWAPGDPLERSLSRLLLLDVDAEPPVLSGDGSVLSMEWLDRDRLTEDEPLLRQLFGLLVLAHYRTTPGDARVLLDSPNLDLCLLRAEGELLGCALVAREGELSDDLAQGVWQGVRRPTGHLLPQALIAHEGVLEVASWSAWRIVRIAVHPGCQHHGLGSRLLQWLVTSAQQQGVDYIGASFAATPALLNYWQGCGFVPVRVGDRHDPVSGSHAVLELRALSSRAQAWLPGMRRRYADALRYRLNGTLKALSVELLPPLFDALQPLELDALDRQLLQGFAFYQRSLESSLVALDKLLRLSVGRWSELGIELPDQALLVERIWRQTPAEQLNWAGGRKAQLARLRELTVQLLDLT